MTAHLAEDEIPRALSQGEGQFREFKSAWDRSSDPPGKLNWKNLRDKIADAVAAFANADGGLLLVGVEDDGRPSGHGYSDEAVEGLLAVPESRLRPEVRCRTARVKIGGTEVLVFEVPQSTEAIMVEADGFPYRVGARILREPQELVCSPSSSSARETVPRSLARCRRYRATHGKPRTRLHSGR